MGKPSPQDVAAQAKKLGRELREQEAQRLAAYLESLMKWSKRMNLVSARGWRDALENLIADSWHLADFLETLELPGAPRTLDLGAGAGLPGLPLRVFWERGRYVLVEARGKRVSFMRFALAQMGLPDTEVQGCRVEELPDDCKPANLIVSRAFMPWAKLLEFVAPLAAPGCRCVIMANEDAPDAAAVPEGWTLAGRTEYAAPGGSRYFWAFASAKASM